MSSADPTKTAEMSRILAELDAIYGAGGEQHLDVEQIAKIMQTSRDPQEEDDGGFGAFTNAGYARPLMALLQLSARVSFSDR